MKLKLILFLFLISDPSSFSQTPSIQWQHCYGGSAGESSNELICTQDGGYLIAGNSLSGNGDVTGNHGNSDAWFLKIDSLGNVIWQKCIGGSNWDIGVSVKEDSLGYVVMGSTGSNDFDINGNHNPNTTTDIWVARLDINRNILWSKCYGGTLHELGSDIQRTYDGGYIISGSTNSIDGDVSGFHYSPTETDIWIIKIDSIGNIEWQKCFGGTEADNVYSIKQLPDSNYILLGFTVSNDGDVIGALGGGDVWLMKISYSNGAIIWQRCLGGLAGEIGYSLSLCNDGGFLIACTAHGNSGEVSGWHQSQFGWSDIWIAKIDSLRNIEWESCFGGSKQEAFPSIDYITDNACIVTCKTTSYDGDVVALHDTTFEDIWILRIDSGQISWSKTIGGTGSDFNDNYHLVKKTHDNGYIACGVALSNNGDVSGNHGGGDFWIAKFSPEPLSVEEYSFSETDFTISFNPNTRNMTISFFSQTNDKVSFNLYDISGRLILQFEINPVVGYHSINQNVANIKQGLYLIRMNDNYGLSKRIMIY